MSKPEDVGIIKLENGMYAYRFTMLIDGKQITKRKTVDENGNKLKTKKQAIRARSIAMSKAKEERKPKKTIVRRTVKEVFEEYRDKGCTDKAYTTLLKQDSLWKNHLHEHWGNCYVDDISAAAVNDYLAELSLSISS